MRPEYIWLTTEGMADRLRELHASPKRWTSREIAGKLNEEFGVRLTRNAIIGKCHRMCLPYREPRLAEKKERKPKVYKPRLRVIEKPKPPRFEGLITIYQLCDGVCNWPMGEIDALPPFMYCGLPTEGNRSWCPEHHKAGHVVMRERAMEGVA